MNTNLIKTIAVGMISGVASFFAGYFIEKKKSDKKIEEIEKEFRDTLAKKSKIASNKPDISELINVKESGKNAVEDLFNVTKEEIVAKPQNVEFIEEGVVMTEPKTKDIEIIDENEYEELYNYTSNILTYYSDGFLVNERNKVVANPKDVIGETALSILDSGERRLIYVKDNVTGSKYEIYYDYNCWLELDEDDSAVGDFADELDE